MRATSYAGGSWCRNGRTVIGNKPVEITGSCDLLDPVPSRCRSRSLQVELAMVASLGHFAYFLENQLANAHAFDQLDWQRSNVPDLQTKAGAVRFVVTWIVA